MTTASIVPLDGGLIEIGEGFSCVITAVGASEVTLTGSDGVTADTLWTLTGGFEAGYSGTASTLTGVTTLTNVKNSTGWWGSPLVLTVQDVIGGSTTSQSWTYYVRGIAMYPPGAKPYNETFESGITVTEDDVVVETDVNQFDFDDATFTVTNPSEGTTRIVAQLAGGTGDVVGPAGATDNAIAVYDTTTGKLLQDSAVTIVSDSINTGSLVASGAIAADTLVIPELSLAPIHLAGTGKFWVKDDAPTTPWFTDDQGNDSQLSVGTGSLEGVIASAPIVNVVDVPASNPVILRDGDEDITPFTVVKIDQSLGTTPAVAIVVNKDTTPGIHISNSISNETLVLGDNEITFEGDSPGGITQNGTGTLWVVADGGGDLNLGADTANLRIGYGTMSPPDEIEFVNGFTVGETASHPVTPVNDKGQYWVNTAGQPMFTSAANASVSPGTDYDLSTGAGGGDVTGPGPTVTGDAVARYDGTGGLTIQESPVIIGDTGNVTGVLDITAETLTGGSGTDFTQYDGTGIIPYAANVTTWSIGGVVDSTGSPIDISVLGTKSGTTGVAGGAVNVFGGNATVGTADGGDLNLSGGSGFGGGSLGDVVVEGSSFQLGTVPLTTSSTIAGMDSDDFDAVTGAASPDSGNVFATMADVGAGGGGTVTSVSISATDGLEVDSGSPITTAGTITLGSDKLLGIEALADVTDATNVATAGALMAADVDADITTLTIGASATVTGSNTGDQTITLEGDVTGTGTGTFTTTIATDAVDIAMLSATGTPSSSTYLQGDNTWGTPAGGGDVISSEGASDTLDGEVVVFDDTDGKLVRRSTTITEGVLDAMKVVTDETAGNPHGVSHANIVAGTHSNLEAKIPDAGTIFASLQTGQINSLTVKGTPVAGDMVMLEDSAAGFGKKKAAWPTGGGSGTVTSVAISATDGLEVDSGSPITTAGTITIGSDKLAGIEAGATVDQTITLQGDVTGTGTTTFTTTIADNSITLNKLTATGSPSSSNFLRGDNTWNTPAGGGDVSATGTPLITEYARWTDATTVEGRTKAETQADLDVQTGVDFDPVGTDNSTDVTLAGEDFLSLSSQEITANPINLDNLSATGTPSSATYLRGDNTWDTPVGSGDVTAGATLVEDYLVIGHLDAKGVKTTTLTAQNVTDNNAKVTNANHTGDVAGDTTLTIGALKVATGMVQDDAVTYAKMQNIVNDNRILGYIGTGPGEVTELTGGNVMGILPEFSKSDTTKGVVLGSDSADNTYYLRADGAWAVPAGGTTDADAIHDNVANEITPITEKAVPVATDVLLIEDSVDQSKKSIQIGNLPVLVGEAGKVVVDARSSGGTITNGQAVYITGWNIGAGVIEVDLANAGSAATMPAYGIAEATIESGTTGHVVVSGGILGQVTTGYTEGDSLWVGETNGTLTDVKPDGTALVQKIATVNRVHSSSGVLQIVGAGRTNDVPNIAQDNLWMGSSLGVATATSRSGIDTDAIHTGDTITSAQHGSQTTETLHAIVVAGATDGFMTAEMATQLAATDAAGTARPPTSHAYDSHSGTVPIADIAGTPTGTGDLVLETSPTIVTPTIASMTNAQHDHSNAAGGGTIAYADITGTPTPGGATLTKSITVEDPVTGETISMFYTDVAITVTQITAVIVGSTSVTFNISHGTSRAAVTNDVMTADDVADSTTTGNITTSGGFTDADIPADSFVCLTTSAASGTPDELHVTVIYTED